MNFKEAYKAMQEGKKVRRKDWGSGQYYSLLKDKIFFIDRVIVLNITVEDSLAEDWEVVEEKKKYWKPKESERYYFIDAYQEGIGNDTNDGTDVDDFRLSIGNYFKTKEEAEHMVEKLKVIHELQKFAYENNEREIDWNDGTQQEHFIFYNHNNDKVDVTWRGVNQFLPFNIYFAPQEIVIKAIETIGADRIKKYYFDVKE